MRLPVTVFFAANPKNALDGDCVWIYSYRNCTDGANPGRSFCGRASTDRDARRKSPLTGAFFCLKIESEYGEPTRCAIKDAEQEAKDIAPSSHRLGSGRHLIRKWLSYETLE